MGTQQMTPELSRQCIEAFNRGRNRRRAATGAAQGKEISISEPGRPGNVNQSESATSSGTINLTESNSMFTNTQPEPTREEIHGRMVEAFKRMGMSEQGAEIAARGRGGRLITIDNMTNAEYREFFLECQRDATLRESRQAEIREAEQRNKENQERMKEAFKRMGFSESAAQSMARGR